jgi:hypothetical protein
MRPNFIFFDFIWKSSIFSLFRPVGKLLIRALKNRCCFPGLQMRFFYQKNSLLGHMRGNKKIAGPAFCRMNLPKWGQVKIKAHLTAPERHFFRFSGEKDGLGICHLT